MPAVNTWNLKFFNSLIPNSCLYEGFSTFNRIVFLYVSAFNTFVLIELAHTCIELHGRNCKLIVWFWKPFHKFKVKFNKFWDLQWSVLHAFATFLLLLYNKVADIFIFSSGSLPIVQCIRGTSGVKSVVSWCISTAVTLRTCSICHPIPCHLVNIHSYPSYPPLPLPFQDISKVSPNVQAEVQCPARFYGHISGELQWWDVWLSLLHSYRLYFLVCLIVSIRLVSFNHWGAVIIFGVAAILVAGFRPYKLTFYTIF